MPVQAGDEELRERLLDLGPGTGRWSEPLDRTTREGGWPARAGRWRRSRHGPAPCDRPGSSSGAASTWAWTTSAVPPGPMLGILGNAEEEYLGVGYQGDADGHPCDGRHAYRIRYAPGGLPPVDAFWSITLYDADRFLYPNPLGMYLLGSRQLSGLVRDPDRGDHAAGPARRARSALEPNWLPCPEGPFHLAFRTYLPGPAIRDGAWEAYRCGGRTEHRWPVRLRRRTEGPPSWPLSRARRPRHRGAAPGRARSRATCWPAARSPASAPPRVARVGSAPGGPREAATP
jgi:hypothetical protein